MVFYERVCLSLFLLLAWLVVVSVEQAFARTFIRMWQGILWLLVFLFEMLIRILLKMY